MIVHLRHSTRQQLTSADRVAIGIALFSFAGGVALLAGVRGFTASIFGVFLVGIAAIAAVSLAFLLIGESEDRHYRKGPQ
jgi:hypothetical protein